LSAMLEGGSIARWVFFLWLGCPVMAVS